MHVTSADGTKIALHPEGLGPDVLLVHGSAADRRDWAAVAPLMGDAFRLHVMDRRGRGGSGDAPDHSLEAEARDVVAACAALGSPLVVAHSLGALIALEAARMGAPMRRLVLYEPPFHLEPMADGLSARLDKLVEAGDLDGALTTFLVEAAGMPEEEVEMMRGDEATWSAGLETAHTLGREFRAHLAFRFDAGRYADVRTPTLLLLGSESPPFFGEAIRALEAALPDARLVTLQGQGHAAMMMAPDLFVGTIVPFLGGKK